MKLSVEMTDEQQKRLSGEAKRLNVAVEELAEAAVRDLLAGPAGDFQPLGHAAMETFPLLNGRKLRASIDDSERIVVDLASGKCSRE